jgi:tetratricopeptide (TPR) repeat protein
LRSEQVDLALRDASRLYEEARRNGDDLARWRGAGEAARAVERLLADAPDQATRAQAVALVQSVTSGLHAAEDDHKLLERLIEIRAAEDDDPGYSITNAAYSRAFRDAEIDVDALTTSQAAGRIKSRPLRVAIAISAALDDWARARRDKLRDPAGALRISQAAREADPDPWRNRLREALEIGDRTKRLAALRELAGSAKMEGLPAVSLDLLGSALREAGAPELALKVLREAQRLIPDDVWLTYDLASCLEALARRNEAIRFYMAARSIRPEVAHTLAHALDQNGEPDRAVELFQELTRLRPNIGRHYRCLGVILRTRGRAQEADKVTEAALRLLREDVRQRPDDIRAAASLGRALTEQGKHQEAIDGLKRALRIRPDDADLHIALGSALKAAGKIDAATEEFRTAIQLDPKSSYAHGELAEALAYGKNDYAAAEAEMRESLRLDPESHSSHEKLGDILSRQGKFPEAIAELRIAASIDPTCGNVRRFIGNALRSQGKVEEALNEYREVLRRQPDDAGALYEFDKLLTDLGRVDELLEAYRAMLRLRPGSDAVLNNIAWKLVIATDRPARDYDEALVYARKCVGVNPKDGNHVNTLALAEYRVGHWNESIAACERSMSLQKGGTPLDWFILAMAYSRRGENEKAGTWFDKAVAWTKEKDPKNAEFLQFWKEAATLLGKPGPTAPGSKPVSNNAK